MGYSLKLDNANFSSSIGQVKLPVQPSSLFLTRGSLIEGLDNLGTEPDGTVTNNGPGITFEPSHASFTGVAASTDNSITTTDLDNESASQTLLLCARKSELGSTSFCPLLGTYNAGASGFSLNTRGASIGTGSLVESPWPADLVDVWVFYAATYGSGSLNAYMGTGGRIANSPQVTGTKVDNSLGLRIGGGYAGAFSVERSISFAAKVRGVMTLQEIKQSYDYVKALMEAFDIEVV